MRNRLFLFFLLALFVYSAWSFKDATSREWYRGNLHHHSQWSDGTPMPAWVVKWYKDRGYHFICMSDHNLFQTDKFSIEPKNLGLADDEKSVFEGKSSRWKLLSEDGSQSKLIPSAVEQAVAALGGDSLQFVETAEKRFYRLDTFDELAEKFQEPGVFLMIPGFEQTGTSKTGRQNHMNFINVRSAFPYQQGETPLDTYRSNFEKGAEQYTGESYLFTLNHPIWPWYDVSPEVPINIPAIRFFELNNNGLSYPAHENGWNPEKFWDVVNAFRVKQGNSLLLGTGSDDNHGYSGEPTAWIMVQADELTPPAIIDSMNKKQFYATSGLFFDSITFNPTAKTLSVSVKPDLESDYLIEFIGTKENFDPNHRILSVPETPREGKPAVPARDIDIYGDDIGVVLKSVEGNNASYTLADDDLYVRARVVKVAGKQNRSGLSYPGAWTQPYSLRVE